MALREPSAPMRAIGALAVAATCLAGAGCGSNAGTEREKALATVDTFLTACADEETIVAIGVLASPTRERFINGGDALEGCQRVLALSLPPLPRDKVKETLRQAHVRIERIGGGFATALIEAPRSRRATVELENLNTIGTEWRIYDPRPTPPAPAGDPTPPEEEPPPPGP